MRLQKIISNTMILIKCEFKNNCFVSSKGVVSAGVRILFVSYFLFSGSLSENPSSSENRHRDTDQEFTPPDVESKLTSSNRMSVSSSSVLFESSHFKKTRFQKCAKCRVWGHNTRSCDEYQSASKKSMKGFVDQQIGIGAFEMGWRIVSRQEFHYYYELHDQFGKLMNRFTSKKLARKEFLHRLETLEDKEKDIATYLLDLKNVPIETLTATKDADFDLESKAGSVWSVFNALSDEESSDEGLISGGKRSKSF